MMRKTSCEWLVGGSLVLSIAAGSGGCKKTDADPASDAEGGITTTTAPVAKASGGGALGTGFEGAITMSMTSARHPPEEMTFLSKGGKLRIEAPGHRGEQGYAIFDSASKKVVTVMDPQKMYMELDLSQPLVPSAAPHGDVAKPTITETGKHETIAGYDCEDWIIKDAKGKRSEACVAQGISFLDFGSMGGMGGGPGGGAGSWMDEFRDKKYFPLKAVELDETGKETSRMEVTKIEKKSLDDALFAPPAGYKKMEMPKLPGGFPGMGGGLPPGSMPPGHK